MFASYDRAVVQTMKKEPQKVVHKFFSVVQNMIHFMSFPASGILRTQNGLVSRCSSVDRALRPVIAKFRVRFPVKPE